MDIELPSATMKVMTNPINGVTETSLVNAGLSSPVLLEDGLKASEMQLPGEKLRPSRAAKFYHDSVALASIIQVARGLICVSVSNPESGELSDITDVQLSAEDSQTNTTDVLVNTADTELTAELSTEPMFEIDTALPSDAPGRSVPPSITNGEHSSEISTSVGEKPATPPPQEPKKRKGGWPKGKKRKKEIIEIKPPKAPTTGYIMFLNERRQEMKETNPELPFAEVTKILGNEWSGLPHEEKQCYLNRADEDKKRYRQELKAYQQTEAYQAFLKKIRSKNASSDVPQSNAEAGDGNDLPLVHDIEDEDLTELYCKVCDQLFNSLHNKKEHLYGRQHLQALTGEIHKETAGPSLLALEDDSPSSGDSRPESQNDNAQPYPASETRKPYPEWNGLSTNVDQAIIDFLSLTVARDKETQCLRKRLVMAKQEHVLLKKQLKELTGREKKLQQDLRNLKSYSCSLSTQLDSLRMVPALFGVINF